MKHDNINNQNISPIFRVKNHKQNALDEKHWQEQQRNLWEKPSHKKRKQHVKISTHTLHHRKHFHIGQKTLAVIVAILVIMIGIVAIGAHTHYHRDTPSEPSSIQTASSTRHHKSNKHIQKAHKVIRHIKKHHKSDSSDGLSKHQEHSLEKEQKDAEKRDENHRKALDKKEDAEQKKFNQKLDKMRKSQQDNSDENEDSGSDDTFSVPSGHHHSHHINHHTTHENNNSDSSSNNSNDSSNQNDGVEPNQADVGE